jgi:hypothetical protein
MLLELRDALVRAFPSAASLDQVVYRAFNARLAEIAQPGTLPEQAFAVLQKATQRQNGVVRLLDAAIAETPENPALRSLRDRANVVDWTGFRLRWPSPPPPRPWWLIAGGLTAIAVVVVVVIFLVFFRPDDDGGGGNGTQLPTSVPQVAVPNVRGDHVSEAWQALVERALVPVQVPASSDSVEFGHVIRTRPQAQAVVDVGSLVTMYVSTGPPRP